VSEVGLRPNRRRPKNGVLAPARRSSSVPETTFLQTHRPSNACLLYFLGEQTPPNYGKVVKFGKTRNKAEIRKQQHETRGPQTCEMKFIGALWGHDSDELSIINYCEQLNIIIPRRNEWVDATNTAFRDWLRFLRNQPFVADNVDDVDRLPFIDSRHWLPNGKNRFEAAQGRLRFDSDPWADLEVSEETEGDYYTHPELIEAAHLTMGMVDLDPASCKEANKIVCATRFFGAQQDGLQMEWGGKVWLNPPFGQWQFWADKALKELRSGRVSEMCVFMTANAATSKQNTDLLRRARQYLFHQAGTIVGVQNPRRQQKAA
jgi:hypothetical protein